MICTNEITSRESSEALENKSTTISSSEKKESNQQVEEIAVAVAQESIPNEEVVALGNETASVEKKKITGRKKSKKVKKSDEKENISVVSLKFKFQCDCVKIWLLLLINEDTQH